ncbi:MAG: rod shape-determining protein [Candidatus Symbiothrix sp.]|jgi:cell division protein FtsA|nr:rod shape-determining protein [Candidatus Symbiothrix sp.]
MEYIAALDLGTSKMIAMAATKNREGALTVLGSEKTDSETCIRRGCIYNIEKTGEKVASLVRMLGAHKLKSSIRKIYVGIGGQSLRTEYHTVRKEINGGIVSNEILVALEEECREYEPELAEIFAIISPEYYLDGRLEMEPKGVSCEVIEAKFQLILGRPSLRICLEKSIEEKAKIEIAGFFVSPLATAEAVLDDRERRLGCALVEFGAGITYISIYKDGFLRYLTAIPLGGNVITKDLCDLGILEPEAEKLKIEQGNARIEDGEEESQDIIVEARANEIVANVIEQIRLSGYENLLGEGIIITGGGSLLKNIDTLLAQKTGKQVRRTAIEDPTQACVLGLLKLGTENCAREVVVKKEPEPTLFEKIPVQEEPKPQEQKPKKRTLWGGLMGGVEKAAKGLFDDDNTNTNE